LLRRAAAESELRKAVRVLAARGEGIVDAVVNLRCTGASMVVCGEDVRLL
jgi:hypothetical protein